MKLRLDKFLANSGIGSRKEVNHLIAEGHVHVNGKVIVAGKTKIEETDAVTVDETILSYRKYRYYMMNKPADALSATRDHRTTVIDFIRDEDQVPDLFPVGRLDKDTTGLLLITNDGRLAHELLSPKHHVQKGYEALLDDDVTEEDRQAFQKGFFLEPEKIWTMPAELQILDTKKALVHIMEGKYHQVKRMFALRGKKVLQLKRISMGTLRLDPRLAYGEYRELTKEELDTLRGLVRKTTVN
ncbi:MAG: rRNA pseudouridine synthase [Peptoniphilaceae bacterium]|nr:rRNA pseudouridine synthase [Peptoniphilaceae bacterium]MDY4195939.1 pseudouridine synthase [Peptoniphilaceae bacterium]MDY5841467.1 pseudouridine synthase [Peptoniphilaceae bacterium]MDY6147279.1 pseudouridine synthase [Peptoniphilaceae bacterium]